MAHRESNRIVRLGFSVAGIAFVLVGVLAFTPGFDVQPRGLVFVLALPAVPFLLYIAGIKSGLGSLLVGTTLLGLTIWTQLHVSLNSYDSTVAVGYVGLFFLGFLVVLAGLIVEGILHGKR